MAGLGKRELERENSRDAQRFFLGGEGGKRRANDRKTMENVGGGRGKEGKGGRNLNNLSPPRFFPRISSKYILVNFENARNVGRTGRNVVYSRGSDKSKVSTRQIYESSSPNRFSKRRYSSRTYLTGDEGFLGKLMRK